ncbi:MAG: FAD:protein FMN transferase [Woeseiaceae bacterium]|nr:FAD:protein FMN transferase [Woeseiaceae bacterium]
MRSKRASAEPDTTAGAPRAGSLRLAPVTALILLLSGCNEPPAPPATSEQFIALGTVVTVRYFEPPPAAAARATAALTDLLRVRGVDWYPWGDGELRRVNAAIAAGEAIDVSAPLAGLLRAAARMEERTGGLFNPALGALTRLWGFNEPLADNWQPPAAAEVARRLLHRPSASSLRWDGNRLVAAGAHVVLDPGGIAKGVLLAEALDLLARHGIADAIVDLGGDLVVRGSAGGRAARVGSTAAGHVACRRLAGGGRG